MYSIKPRVVSKTRQPRGGGWGGGKEKLCFCHVVRLCVAEQGADFVTLKYTRKVLWWAAGEKIKRVAVAIRYSAPTSKETSFRLRIILKSGIS